MKTELATWLGTYWVHSTVIFAGAWLLLRAIPRTSHRVRETVWKTALLGGFVTATAQLLLSMPAADSGAARFFSLPVDSAVSAESSVLEGRQIEGADNTAHRATLQLLETSREPNGKIAKNPSTLWSPDTFTTWQASSSILWGVVSLWLLGTLVGIARWRHAHQKLMQFVEPRTAIHRGSLLYLFRQLCRKASVRTEIRLTDSRRAPSPMALRANEICLPAEAMSKLPESEQRAMLAHELAHIIRRDPLWLTLSQVIETLFFFQPVNRVIRKEIQREAEFLADDWAITHSDGGLVLARCLATVAGWVEQGGVRLATVSAMAEHDSTLVDRVQRLVDGTAGPSRNLPLWIRVPILAALCLGVIVAAPRVSARVEMEPRFPAGLAEAEAHLAREEALLEQQEARFELEEGESDRREAGLVRAQHQIERATELQRYAQQQAEHALREIDLEQLQFQLKAYEAFQEVATRERWEAAIERGAVGRHSAGRRFSIPSAPRAPGAIQFQSLPAPPAPPFPGATILQDVDGGIRWIEQHGAKGDGVIREIPS